MLRRIAARSSSPSPRCGGGGGGAAHRRRQGHCCATSLWDTNQKPVYQKCADKFEQAEPEHQDPDREQELGRLLERARPRLHRRDRARRLHRPPRQVPAVRAERGDRAGQHPKAVDMNQYLPGLAQLWKSPDGKQYGFPKDWDTVAVVVNEDMLKQGRRHQAAARHGDLEPDRRRDVRADRRQAHGRQQRQARRRARLRPEATSRPTGSRFDPGGLTYGQTTWAGFARQPRLQAARQEPVGHEVQLRRPALRADDHAGGAT